MFSPPPAMVYVLLAASYVAEPGPIVDGVPTSLWSVNTPSDCARAAAAPMPSHRTVGTTNATTCLNMSRLRRLPPEGGNHKDSREGELEPYTQARLGGNRRPETTGNAVTALFEHDSARPVNRYAAPQLHTHAVIFNLTETADGTVRPLQPRELYRTQQYATAVYRSELAARLTALGYEIERGRSGQPEIRGYSREYLDASSPRRQQIEDYLAEADRQGAAAAQIAAHQTREAKLDVSHDEMQQRHQEVAERFGNQPTQVVEAAEHRPVHHVEHEREQDDVARRAVTFARDRNLEREAVVEERAILRDALQRSLGETRLDDI